jgi:hypothetical protein
MEIVNHGKFCKGNLERTDVQEERTGETIMQQRHKEARPKRMAVSWKQEDIQQDLRENHQAGDQAKVLLAPGK